MAGSQLQAAIILAIPVWLADIGVQAEETPRFDLPVACPADIGCVVRSFVDHDSGPDARDWRCGGLTYDGHKGTDIRVPDGGAMAAGVPVLAAASGRVLRLRDDMDDVSIRVTGADAVRDREAGNSIIIDHGGGWETQYGHLRKGSILVEPGDSVAAGQPIAIMGLSGNTEFTHLHFELRRDGAPIDPFSGAAMAEACGTAGPPLLTDGAMAALPYREEAPFDAGFAVEKADPWKARAGDYATTTLEPDSPALVFWVDVLGHQAGDRQAIRLVGPGGVVLAQSAETAAETRVQWFQFVGIRRPDAGWPAGTYRGEYGLTRLVAGQPQLLITIERALDIR